MKLRSAGTIRGSVSGTAGAAVAMGHSPGSIHPLSHILIGEPASTPDQVRGRLSLEYALIARQDNVFHQRVDLSFPALAAEHAVVADAGLHVVALEIGPQRRAEIVRRDRLADRAD